MKALILLTVVALAVAGGGCAKVDIKAGGPDKPAPAKAVAMTPDAGS